MEGNSITRRMLIVDDEDNIRMIVRKYAEFDGYIVDEAENGMEAVEKAQGGDYDIIVMDVMMPELDGFSALKEIRKTSPVPCVMLSARGEEYDKIHGFELGVDDYVVKPFSPRELMLRINAILARYDQQAGRKELLVFDGLSIDSAARSVYVDGEKINLSPKTYDLLLYLVRNKGIALTREQIINRVWGYDFYGDERTLDTHVKLLRNSLGDYRRFIVTLRGVGYRFEA
ncbi:MAG: response regulator transcription factor [Firmicutes bacterium]|nr:response regulator transcription factor [Bacillota bacterium]MBQ3112735.1 response regulator transcription factor [Bacillota bacterium]MBQ6842598.1 response regulator transcription factor [Bacillota bacterium]MBR6823521.1 response regulator transcription factor [Bacillota bacterium]MBR7113799.1 response regulator transcription factor [Bacillota bacterium]